MFTYEDFIMNDFINKWNTNDFITNTVSNKSNTNDPINKKKMANKKYGIRNTYPKPKKVIYDETAGVTVVLWEDSTKTIVRAAEGDAHDAYLGYCTALAKKIHGTNSALKRDLDKVLVVTKKKQDCDVSFSKF